MTKRYAETQITITETFRDSAGDPVDPTTVTFTYRIGRDGEDKEATPTAGATGVYSVTITPECDGNLYGTFKGIGAHVETIPVHVPIYPKDGIVG